jgi:hypothetical protein
MPFPRGFYRAVTSLSQSRSEGDERAAISRVRPESDGRAVRRVASDFDDLDLDHPEEALAALRRVVAEARAGEQLTPLRKSPPHLRHLEVDAAQALAVYSRRRSA